MDLYQAGYYRLGSQGSKSGWQLVSPSVGMSQKAKDGFKGIAANIIELKATGVPTFVSGIFTYDNFVYLLHTNYRAQGTDSRGVSYAHCYCFGYKEYLELSKEPERLFGILDGAFPNEYSGTKAYPVVNEIPYAPMNAQAILDKYGISNENYKKMLLGAISASEGLTPPLCIKKELPIEEYENFYKEMMFIIFKGLPEYLRIKITSFSFRGNKNIPVYVSDKVETTNYIDFDAGEFNTDYTRLSNYRFTMVYNMNVAPHMLGDVWKSLSAQTDAILENPLRDNSCLYFEEMFQAWQKKSQAGNSEIEPELAVDLLTAFSSFTLLESVETYDYFAALIDSINRNNLAVADKKILKGLHDRYERSQVAHAQYKAAVELLTLRMIFNGHSEEATAFNELFNLKKSYPTMYANLKGKLSKQDIELAFKFYLDKELGSQLNTYNSLESFIRNLNRNDATPVANPFMRQFNRAVELFKQVTSRNCLAATDNNTFKEAAYGALKLSQVILDANVLENQAATNLIKYVFSTVWDCFNTNWFNPADAEFYRKELHIDEINPKHFDEKICANVNKVKTLINLATAPYSVEYLNDAMAVVYTNNHGLSDAKKTELMDFIYNRMFVQRVIPTMRTQGAFDLMLTVTYSSASGTYLADKLGIRMKSCKTDDMFDSNFVEFAICNSALLRNESYKNILLNSINTLLDAVSRDKNITYPKDAIQGLKKYKRVLEGGDASPDSKNNFVTSIYRSFLSVMVFTALAFFSVDILNYFGLEGSMKIVVFAVAVAFFVIAPFIAWGFANEWFSDMATSFEGYGVNEVPKLIIYLLISIILIVAIVVLFILKMSLWIIAMVALGYVAASLLMMILRDFMVENS